MVVVDEGEEIARVVFPDFEKAASRLMESEMISIAMRTRKGIVIDGA